VCNASLFPSPNSGTDGEPPQETAGCQGTRSDAYTLDTVQVPSPSLTPTMPYFIYMKRIF
jgi:hypothetical protein